MDHSSTRDKLLERLWACAAACEYCADKFQENDAEASMGQCIRICRDCSDMCVLTARFAARRSAYLTPVISLCIELCEVCIRECSGHDALYARDCVEACSLCAGSCREYESAYTG